MWITRNKKEGRKPRSLAAVCPRRTPPTGVKRSLRASYQTTLNPTRAVNGARITDGRRKFAPVAWLIVSNDDALRMLNKSRNARTLSCHRSSRAAARAPSAAAALGPPLATRREWNYCCRVCCEGNCCGDGKGCWHARVVQEASRRKERCDRPNPRMSDLHNGREPANPNAHTLCARNDECNTCVADIAGH